ncbi:MAG: hypothetical protein IJN16_06800 [Lachnospiraceae bacterium]|nr:hypothetical protein [Lachnospiraceae bacterium]
MKDWKSICNKLLFPPFWVVMVLTVISTVALVAIFVKDWENTPIAYLVYVVSFYALTVICLICWKVIPGYYRSINGKVNEYEYANRYLTDAGFKTHVNLYCSLVFNLLYVVVNAVSGIIYSTYWFGIFAVYYAIMAIMRFLLVRYVNKNTIGKSRLGELKCARLCACILLTVNLALSGAVLMMIYFDRGFQYQGFLIYVIALYTFYITTTAIIDMVKYRKYNSPIMSISKIIKLASSLFSMLFLETAMLSQFGGDTSPEAKRIMIMATGGGISIIVVVIAVYMIVCTTKEIRKCGKGD